MSQTIFQANLASNVMYIDLANMPPTSFLQQFQLEIKNQSLQILYFTLTVSNLPNWSLSNPSNGRLGSVAAGSSSYFFPILTRSTPTSGDTSDTGYLTITVFSDANYTTQIDYANLTCTVYLENTENWSDVTIEPFAVGNSYGWTNGTLNNDISVEANGYNYTSTIDSNQQNTDVVVTFTRNNTVLSSKAKLRMTFYGVLKGQNTAVGDSVIDFLKRVQVQINGTTVYDTSSSLFAGTPSSTPPAVPQISVTGVQIVYSQPWLKFTVDLSAYSGQTVNITILVTLYEHITSQTGNIYCWFIMDRVVRAGSD